MKIAESFLNNTVGKGEIAHYEQFLLFPQFFQKACFPGASKGVIVWEYDIIAAKRSKQGQYSPTILKNILRLILQIILYLEAFVCNTTSNWLNRMVSPIRSCVTFKFTESCRKRQRMFLRMVGEYRPRCYNTFKSR